MIPQGREQFDALKRDFTHLNEIINELLREQARLQEHSTVLAGLLAKAGEAQRDLRSQLATAQPQVDRLLLRPEALNSR